MDSKVIIGHTSYNGECYLKEQLDSLLAQTYKSIEIIARDDGSTDGTVKILSDYGVKILPSDENCGPKISFSILLDAMLQDKKANYFMFCDQDDIWDKNKVAASLAHMQKMELKHKELPLLVHTDLLVVDKHSKIISSSFWHYEHINPQRNKLGNLLMQNTVTGCTMLFNRRLAQLARPIPKEAIMHDWWMALVASAFGVVGVIDEPYISYRQHGRNDTGAKAYSWKKIVRDAGEIIFGRGIYSQHLDINIVQASAFLDIYSEKLSRDLLLSVEAFASIKKQNFFQKRLNILRYGLLKYGFFRNLGLMMRI